MPPPLALLLLLLTWRASADGGSDDYEACKNEEKFGTDSLVCDRDHLLAPRTVKRLSQLLTDLQTRIRCDCPDGCRRADGRDGYIGLLQITNSDKVDDLKELAKTVYEDQHLGNESCRHGLLIVYFKDKQQLATYRGGDSLVVLTDEDMKKLHELATKGSVGEGDTLALQYLLANYNEDVAKPSVQRAETWTPVIGLVVAILIVLLIIACLLALFLSRICCCAKKGRKKDIYHVNTLPAYKTIEPIYVVTPPMSSPEGIYSTPYSGSPLPFAPPPGTSRPVTPNSTYRMRINPMIPPPLHHGQHGTLPPTPNANTTNNTGGGGGGGVDTPASRRKAKALAKKVNSTSGLRSAEKGDQKGQQEPVRRSLSDISRPLPPMHMYPPPAHYPYYPPFPPALPPPGSPAGAQFSPRSIDAASLQPSMLSESDLSFLDPRRKLETQTREETIY